MLTLLCVASIGITPMSGMHGDFGLWTAAADPWHSEPAFSRTMYGDTGNNVAGTSWQSLPNGYVYDENVWSEFGISTHRQNV